jgi:hypothetical protein
MGTRRNQRMRLTYPRVIALTIAAYVALYQACRFIPERPAR